MRTKLLAAFAASLILAPTQAQIPGEAPETSTGKPLPGVKAGTESWIVHFASRPFDLSAFRAEMHGNKNPDVVDAIVKDLESKVQAHQKNFVDDVIALGGRVTHQWWLVNACCIEIAPKHLPALRAMNNVAQLEPNIETFPLIKTATNSNNHNSDLLNSRGVTGRGVACAIIDTGQDENMNGSGKPHITYSNNGSTTATRLVRNVKLGAMSADDVHGHGTGVASIAAGWKWRTTQADNGHAYNANIVGYAIANNTGGSSSAALEAAGYQNAAADAARYVIVATNLSYSGSQSVTGVAALAMDSAALNADLFNATAAGNSGSSVASSLPNLSGLSVGAVTENSHTIASFSSRGVQGGRLFPNFCANGVSTDMARRNNESSNYIGSGTSMASPQACGAATLIRGANRALKADETRAILLAATEKNPGSGAGMNSTGTGCGYLRDDLAHGVATTPSLHGRATLSRTTTVWRKSIAVTKGKTVQLAIAWNRLNVTSSGTSWSNLNLALKRGTTTLASSATSLNLEEFIRYVPATTETLIMEVTLVGAPVGGTTQPFGWATYFDSATIKVPGKYVLYGSGCKGTGILPAGGPVVPKGYDNTWGVSGNSFPWGYRNLHYMQAHAASDFPGTAIVRGLAFRNRRGVAQFANVRTQRVRVGYTRNNARALNTTFASNWSGTPVVGFNGNLNTPAFAAQTDPKVWTLKVPFTAPFVYNPALGNFLWEVNNSSTTSPGINYFDRVSGATVQASRLYNTSGPNAATGTLGAGYCVTTQLIGTGGPGAIVNLTNTGVPETNSSFQVKVGGAAQNTVAILWLGATQLNVSLGAIAPGCSLYTSLDVLLGGIATGTSGAGSISIGLPNNASLVGLSFSNQWMVLDSGANTLGLALSNGGRGTIGG